MTLTTDDLKKIERVVREAAEEVSSKHTDELAVIVVKGFEEQRQYMDRRFDEHTQILNEHSKILNKHTQILNEHSKTLREHGEMLEEHTERLERVEYYQKVIVPLVDRHDNRLRRVEQTLGLPPLPQR